MKFKKIVIRALGTYVNILATIYPRRAGVVGYHLFCTPMRAPLKPHHQAFLNSAKSKIIPYKDIDIQTYKWGFGPSKVLFLHGWQSHTFRWKKYIEAFPMDQYTLIAMDAPAHGLSEGKEVNAISYAEAFQSVLSEYGSFEAVVGHSFGGFSALYAIYQNKDLPVKGLVLMGVPGSANDFFQEGARILNLNQKADAAIRKHFMQLFNEQIEQFSTVRFAYDLDIKGLVIHDVSDKEAGYANAVSLANTWGESKLITTDGLGHQLYSDQIVQSIISFVNSLSTSKPLNKESS